ncbi:HAMP domain-containing sensor histidine kinase [Ferrovibrio sp.]|uniref:sensor histidine kinase n=1 Tax=Ferrovibrio sp. TaxID=1917215 RepID=UPI00261F9857|nr:HAMP domain-containing sensor histidine kinase [Ferrovibrio sp.]
MRPFRQALRRIGSDRIIWRIAGTILLAILCTQIATVLLLRSTRPGDMPVYPITTLMAEMQRHIAGTPPAEADILHRLSDPGPPPETGRPLLFPFRDVEYRLRQSLVGPAEIRIGVDFPRRPGGRLLFWPLPVPRIAVEPPEPGPPPHDQPPRGLPPGPPPGPPPGLPAGAYPPPPPGGPYGSPHPALGIEDFQVPGIFTIWVRQAPEGEWQAWRPKQSFEPIEPWLFTLLWFAVIAAIIAALTFWSTWRLLRPLKALVTAAQDWRAEQEPTPLPERGPLEFRAIASAFNDMQGEIGRFVRDRSELVVALSHDLRTPLTRLQLRAEYIDDPEQRQRMLDELHFMETLTDQLLSFTSFNPGNEAVQRVDIAVLLTTLCDDRSDAGAVVEYAGPAHLVIDCRPTAILRAMMNLVENAIKYSDFAYVSLQAEADGVRIFIRDSGSGIPESELKRVFQPFYRVDASRNRETGGLGMGLSVARAIVLEHRGRITLRNRQPHGLEVEIYLPTAQHRPPAA